MVLSTAAWSLIKKTKEESDQQTQRYTVRKISFVNLYLIFFCPWTSNNLPPPKKTLNFLYILHLISPYYPRPLTCHPTSDIISSKMNELLGFKYDTFLTVWTRVTLNCMEGDYYFEWTSKLAVARSWRSKLRRTFVWATGSMTPSAVAETPPSGWRPELPDPFLSCSTSASVFSITSRRFSNSVWTASMCSRRFSRHSSLSRLLGSGIITENECNAIVRTLIFWRFYDKNCFEVTLPRG